MSRITPVSPAAADPKIAATLNAVKSKLGLVPNLVTTLARAPAALNGYLALSEALSHGTLSAKQREIVALAVAQSNGCDYCLSAHTVLGKGAGLKKDEIDAARIGSGSNSHDSAIAGFAKQATRQRGVFTDAEFNDAREAGLSDGEILEIVAHISLNVLTNYTNHIAGTEIDFPVVTAQSTPQSDAA